MSAQLCMCAREDSGPVRCLPCIAPLGQGWPCPVGSALSLRHHQQDGGTHGLGLLSALEVGGALRLQEGGLACKVGPASLTVAASRCLM